MSELHDTDVALWSEEQAAAVVARQLVRQRVMVAEILPLCGQTPRTPPGASATPRNRFWARGSPGIESRPSA